MSSRTFSILGSDRRVPCGKNRREAKEYKKSPGQGSAGDSGGVDAGSPELAK